MKHVLIVDDDETIQELLKQSVEKLGYKSTVASDGRMAVDVAAQEVFDLILMDIKMPIMDGMKALEKIRIGGGASSNTPVIMVTANTDKAMVKSAIKLGANDYMVKPFYASVLLDRVCHWINSAQEKQWKRLKPQQEKILTLTVATLEAAFKAVRGGKELPYTEFRDISSNILEVMEKGEIDSVLDALKDHDSYTFVHSMRVGIYLSMFAKNFGGFGHDDLMVITSGGVIHDVGKAMTPLKVLNKPGAFEPEEWLQMKEHVIHTVEILKKTPGIPTPILEIGWNHHEKIDGSGYPRGLKGEEIGMLSRMSAIVDVYVALTDRRVYKPAFAPEKSLEMMKNPPGHLDQELLAAFTEIIQGSL